MFHDSDDDENVNDNQLLSKFKQVKKKENDWRIMVILKKVKTKDMFEFSEDEDDDKDFDDTKEKQ